MTIMFYCTKCQKKNDWPVTKKTETLEHCAICNNATLCNNAGPSILYAKIDKPMFTEGKWELNEIQPWEIWVGADKHIASVHGQQEVRSANAKRIVHCCNNFDEVCEALKNLYEYCNDHLATADCLWEVQEAKQALSHIGSDKKEGE